jgi:hypothetical protein
MAVFDPNDWRDRWSWLHSKTKPDQHRRPWEINQEVVTRWLASAALCLCFAVLAPAGHLGLTFGLLLVAAALSSACLAALRGEPFHAPHLTAWDEALASSAVGLVVVLWAHAGLT